MLRLFAIINIIYNYKSVQSPNFQKKNIKNLSFPKVHIKDVCITKVIVRDVEVPLVRNIKKKHKTT